MKFFNDLKLKLSENKGKRYAKSGFYYSHIFFNDLSNTFFNRALKNLPSNCSNLISKIYNEKGLNYQYLKRFDQSLECFKAAINYRSNSRTKGDPEDLEDAMIYDNLALLYIEIGKYYQAKKFLKLSLNIKKDYNNIISNIDRTYMNYGIFYHKLDQPDYSLNYYKKSLDIKLEKKDYIMASVIYYNIALVYQDMGKTIESRNNIEIALELQKKKLGGYNPYTIKSENMRNKILNQCKSYYGNKETVNKNNNSNANNIILLPRLKVNNDEDQSNIKKEMKIIM